MNRLIDADALHMILVKMKDFGELTAKKAIRAVENAPTIDAVPVSELHGVEKERDYWMDMAHSYEQTILRLTISAGEVPVRHGKWRFVNCATGLRCQCSECLHWVDAGTDRNYCPNCGARMDKDD